MTLDYPFTEEDSRQAHDEWGANCGPNALAFALQLPIGRIRGVIPGFEEKRYTSPSMMRAALLSLGARYFGGVADRDNLFRPIPALVRVQFTGPWTAPGANPRWAYCHTHWVVTWREVAEARTVGPGRGFKVGTLHRDRVFDCNGGIQSFEGWTTDTIPAMAAAIRRADGGWHPTHVWRLDPPVHPARRLTPTRSPPCSNP